MTKVDSNGLYNGMPIEDSGYNYLPTRWVAIVFLTLFGISTLTHAVQAVRYRLWYLIFTACLCGVLELLGWSGRLWSSWDPFLDTPFKMEITCTIFGPTPFIAAIFVIFGEIIKRLGPAYSRLTPKWYTIIFCTSDVVALLIQCAGGGLAASASTNSGAKLGSNIMLVGIVFQVVVITVFSLCAVEYVVRYFKDMPIRSRTEKSEAGNSTETLTRGELTTRIKLMLYAILFIMLLLFIRSIYRTAELADGWNGRIISTEVYFNVLDGAMVVLAIITLNVAHPGVLLAMPEALQKYPQTV